MRLRIDAWIATQPEPRPSRSEAIRRLLAQALGYQETARVRRSLTKAALPEDPTKGEPNPMTGRRYDEPAKRMFRVTLRIYKVPS